MTFTTDESDFLTAQRQFFADKAKAMREFTGERSKGHDFYQAAYEAYASDSTEDESTGAA